MAVTIITQVKAEVKRAVQVLAVQMLRPIVSFDDERLAILTLFTAVIKFPAQQHKGSDEKQVER